MSVTTNTPFGFRYYKNLNGSITQEILNPYVWNDTTASVYEGDPVSLVAATANAPQDGNKRIQIAPAAGTTVGILGIARGVRYTDSSGNPVFAKYFAANTSIKSGTYVEVLVSDDPNTLYLVQGDDSVANNRMSYNFEISNMGTQATNVTGQSGATLDSSTAATTATYPLKIYGLASTEAYPGNINTVDYPVFIVRLNNHVYGSAVAGF